MKYRIESRNGNPHVLKIAQERAEQRDDLDVRVEDGQLYVHADSYPTIMGAVVAVPVE